MPELAGVLHGVPAPPEQFRGPGGESVHRLDFTPMGTERRLTYKHRPPPHERERRRPPRGGGHAWGGS